MSDYKNLLNTAIAAMNALHASLEPDDDNETFLLVPPDALTNFVNTHATLLYERQQLADNPPQQAIKT